MPAASTYRTCPNGHRYKKSSACPVCPKCEALKTPASAFMAKLSAPAQRALEHAGITSLKKLSAHSEKEILKLHGMGKASLPVLRALLKEAGLEFIKEAPPAPKNKAADDWLRQQCLLLPGTLEQPHFEKTSFRFGKKIFVTLDTKNNKACFKLPPGDQDVFSRATGGAIYPVPNKWGLQGWTFAEMNKADKRVIKQMIGVAYQEVSREKDSRKK